MSTLRSGHPPPVIGVVLQPIPGVVHPKVSACLESVPLLSDERVWAFLAGSTG